MPRKFIIPVVIAVLGVACLLVAVSVLPRRTSHEYADDLADTQGQVAGLDEKPGISVESVHFVGRSEGGKRWEFRTDRAMITYDDDWVGLDGIRDGVFYDGDEVWMYFTAREARVNTKTDSLRLENVVFQSASGDSLSADRLSWDENSDKVILEGNVLIRQGPDAVMTCARAEYAPGDNILETVGETVLEIEIRDD